MITVLLENVSLRDLSVEVIDSLQEGHPTVFSGVLRSGEIEPVIVAADDRDYAKVTWHATTSPGHPPRVQEATVGPGDTVEIGA